MIHSASLTCMVCGHKHVYITPALTTPLNQHDESMMAQANWWLVVMMQMMHVYPQMHDFITLTFLVKLIYWNLYLLDVQLNWQTDIIRIVSHTSRIWWHHLMKTFFKLMALCGGNPPVTGEFPFQRPVTWSCDVFCNLCLTSCWVNNRDGGDLRCHRAHYDFTVMT